VTASDHSDISPLRASDADRDQTAAIIGTALADGRLTAQEHSERLAQVYAARIQADLAALVQDLPGPAAGQRPVPAGAGVASPSGHRIIAIFGGTSRNGTWRVAPVTDVVTVFGGAELDLRDAVPTAREITIRTVCVFGGVSVTVPPEMHVTDSGFAVFGGREVCPDSAESARPGAPVLRLTGACVFGGIDVKREPRTTRSGGDRAAGEIAG
jgi:Domain of unknown function (DUF1707)/Cell wall-active antibiotics response 4TMS YvqF